MYILEQQHEKMQEHKLAICMLDEYIRLKFLALIYYKYFLYLASIRRVVR